MSPTPTVASSSATMSSGVLISQSDGIAEQVTNMYNNMRLSEDVPIHSIEGDSADPSGGVNISRGTSHFRTPSLSLSPPPDGDSELRASPRYEGPGRRPSSNRTTDSIDGHLGMSQVAAAIEGVATGSDSPGVLLSPEPPVVSNDSSNRRVSRRRSSSRTQIPPHDVVDEELPHDRFNEPAFQSAFSDAKSAVAGLAAVISSSHLSNEPGSTMKRLYEEGGRLAQFRCPSTRTVGFVGDSGVGK